MENPFGNFLGGFKIFKYKIWTNLLNNYNYTLVTKYFGYECQQNRSYEGCI